MTPSPPQPGLPRVASLLPSATEMVAAVGLADALVGISHECDFPAAAVADRRVLTSSKIRFGSSGEVDRDVRRVLRDALAVYDIDLQALGEARPDVIVTQDLCDVCAVSLDDVRAAAREVAGGAEIVSLHPTRLSEILDDLVTVGRALGRAGQALEARAALEARIADVERRGAEAVAAHGRPRVLTIEWIDPVMIGGTWMPELVTLAGGAPLVTEPGQHAPTLSRDELALLAPEVVLIKPCGFPIERTLEERDTLVALFDGLVWPALEHGRVWIADGNAYFNRPGPRIVESLEILAACVHPRTFADEAARHAGSFVHFA